MSSEILSRYTSRKAPKHAKPRAKLQDLAKGECFMVDTLGDVVFRKDGVCGPRHSYSGCVIVHVVIPGRVSPPFSLTLAYHFLPDEKVTRVRVTTTAVQG